MEEAVQVRQTKITVNNSVTLGICPLQALHIRTWWVGEDAEISFIREEETQAVMGYRRQLQRRRIPQPGLQQFWQ